MSRTHAIILAGGRSQRLGVDKLQATVGGRSLLDLTLDAVAGLDGRVVVVGPPRPGSGGGVTVQEQPAFGGPAAASVAGLTELDDAADTDAVLILAADIPRIAQVVAALTSEGAGPAGRLVTSGGREQWTASLVPVGLLRRRAEALGDPAERSLRELLGPLQLEPVEIDPAIVRDVDTPRDARELGVELPAGATSAVLADWWRDVCEALAIEHAPLDVDTVLDLAGQAAHRVVRPAAPVTTYLLGLALGQAMAREQATAGSAPNPGAADSLARLAPLLGGELAPTRPRER